MFNATLFWSSTPVEGYKKKGKVDVLPPFDCKGKTLGYLNLNFYLIFFGFKWCWEAIGN